MEQQLNRHSSLPLHAQIHEIMRDKIATETLEAGAVFPSERELSESFGVNRLTIRQALQSLRQEGLIYQKRGVGTFVSKRKIDVHTRNLGGFTDEMNRRGMVPSSKILLLRQEKATPETAVDLGIEENVEVFQIQRLRLADNVPMSFETAFLPVTLFPDLDSHDLANNSLYRILEKNYDVRMSRAEEILEAAAASANVAKLLQIKQNEPVLVVHRVVFSETNQAIESVISVYRADRYRATFHLKKTN